MNAEPELLEYPFPDAPGPDEAIPVADGVFWCRLSLPMALDHVNVYALDDGDSWTIVDTGLATKRSRAFWSDLLQGALGAKPVSRVIVTHHHPDHVGLAGWFQTEHAARLMATRTAWLFARMLLLDEQPTPVPESVSFWRAAGMDQERIDRRLSERPFNYADVVDPMPLGFERLRENDVIEMGNRRWTVRLGQGHAPDQATFWSEDGHLVLGADQLLPSISPNLGVYATEPLADPVAEWLSSCDAFMEFATQEQLVLPGHKLPYRGLPLRLRQLKSNHTGALQRLLERLREPATAAECFQTLFLREIGDGEYGLALVEAMAHCIHLWHRGLVTRTIGKGGAWVWKTI